MDDSHPFRSLSIGCPIPEIKLFQTLTLKLQGQCHECSPKGKVMQLAQYHINSLPFHLTSIRPTILEKELFRNLTLKYPRSRSWVRSKVKVTYCTQYPTNALPFRFTSIRPTIPEIWPKLCWPWKNQPKLLNTICQNYMSGSHFIAQTSKFLLMDATRSWKGYPVHFPRPIYSLCQKSKV